jgi:cell wall-associated NlpC family hydrolase
MDDRERQSRDAVLHEARSWLRTPYAPDQRVKGAGVDCAQLPAAVYHACGLIPYIPIEYYPPDWHLHRSEERYLSKVLEHADEIEGPPLWADFALWHVGRCWAHGAIVVAWPRIIHAIVGQGVVIGDAARDCLGRNHRLASMDVHFYSVFGRA